ncbi:hypothetical protein H5410_054326 [Solanum commersonii]|uniref:Post-GPI attachment to proteins factor 3 n=1 Tax=Solanum commersonii TaxID=4109 RepID=A0A9J5WGV9_SOLCO|nr:hypothetical protein H5410_054326 [Solanum commersonii]
MADCYWITFLVVLFCLVGAFDASAGDADPLYRACFGQCKETGCAGETCFAHCNTPLNGSSSNDNWYLKEPLYLWLKQANCLSDCQYHCMLQRETERATHGFGPVKYHGKWPFKRVFGLQEPVSVAFSALNLAMHLHGWLSFFTLIYYKLQSNADETTCYNYTSLWHIYAFLSINSWLWSAIFHGRDMDFTEKLDYSSAVLLLGFSLIVSVLRSFSVKNEATRVLVAAPLLAFTITHILMEHESLCCDSCFSTSNLVNLGWNKPSSFRWKLWTVVVGGGLAMLLEIYDFPPYQGLVDAHALWHATTIPLTYIWWSFIKDDAKYGTSNSSKKDE